MTILSEREAAKENAESEPAETGTEGVLMVVLWILLTIALVVLTRRRGKQKPGELTD